MKTVQDLEILDIVDEKNRVIGSTSIDEIYDKKLSHRVVHILVLHPKNPAIYLQRRAPTKSFLPNYYCTSAGGHVHSGETYEEAAIRELKEEIGITTSLTEVDSFIFIGENGHQRFIRVFIAKISDGFSFIDGEVSEGMFFSLSDAKKMIDADKNIHPQLAICFNRLWDINFFDFYNK